MQEFEIGDFIRCTGDELGTTVDPPEQRSQGHCRHNLKSEIDQWSAIIKKTGVYAD